MEILKPQVNTDMLIEHQNTASANAHAKAIKANAIGRYSYIPYLASNIGNKAFPLIEIVGHRGHDRVNYRACRGNVEYISIQAKCQIIGNKASKRG